MRILTISKQEHPGGANMSASALFRAYRDAGHDSFMAVGTKRTDDPHVFEIPTPTWRRNLARKLVDRESMVGHGSHLGRLLRYVGALVAIEHYLAKRSGTEDFHFSGTRRIIRMLPGRPDIIHCHNLHANYFDLRVLPWISRQGVLILNPRDSWLMTGHCAYPTDCERWKTGCGSCPYLRRYVAVDADNTAYNWQRKMNIYAKSTYALTAPSEWQMNQALESPLGAHSFAHKVIPNGIDLSIFTPTDMADARCRIGVPVESRIVLMSAHNEFKNIDGLIRIMRMVDAMWHSKLPLLCLCLGRDGGAIELHNGRIEYRGYVSDSGMLRDYYCASDVYLHAARAEAFGKAITEAMACGTPVVAFAVGGIVDQVLDGKVGFLVADECHDVMAERVCTLLGDKSIRGEMGAAAHAHAARHYSVQAQVDRFLTWYEELLELRRRQRE